MAEAARVYPDDMPGEATFVEVTPEDAARGYVMRECPSCQGTGVCIWHPEYPEVVLDCVRCSTRGEVGVTV